MPSAVFANGNDEHVEATVWGQLNELLPFEHVSESHWVAFIVSVILWVSLIYTISVLAGKLLKRS